MNNSLKAVLESEKNAFLDHSRSLFSIELNQTRKRCLVLLYLSSVKRHCVNLNHKYVSFLHLSNELSKSFMSSDIFTLLGSCLMGRKAFKVLFMLSIYRTLSPRIIPSGSVSDQSETMQLQKYVDLSKVYCPRTLSLNIQFLTFAADSNGVSSIFPLAKSGYEHFSGVMKDQKDQKFFDLTPNKLTNKRSTVSF